MSKQVVRQNMPVCDSMSRQGQTFMLRSTKSRSLVAAGMSGCTMRHSMLKKGGAFTTSALCSRSCSQSQKNCNAKQAQWKLR